MLEAQGEKSAVDSFRAEITRTLARFIVRETESSKSLVADEGHFLVRH